ncbi:MAG: glutamate--cysteine ligase, partial [Magnetococcales bacterium]|nr:glutamate--cysteine ligase [Magnetococcales bacterium]
LIEYMTQGCTPRHQWRIGCEHEKFGFRRADLTPIPYDGPDGVRAILEGMMERFGWAPILENGKPIGLLQDGASVTLEPGGQVELSGAPLETIHQIQQEINTHLEQLGAVCHDLNTAFLGIGAQPKWPFDDIPWMPKGRYRLMRAYLPTKGHLSLDMMARTATVQANLDFESEADMVLKFRTSLAIQPLVTALFANSPFINGAPAGQLSHRAEIWRYTDPDRCGAIPFVFEPGFGFERYVDYALDTPMLFIYRNGQYMEGGGVPFRRYLEGTHPALPGQHPTLDEWETHLSTLFPDVRLKRYLEMRGADAGNSANICALPALWKGILYDDEALNEVWQRIAGWTPEQRQRIHEEAPREALKTPINDRETLQDLALFVLEKARGGLHRLDCKNSDGCDESIFLDTLFQIAVSGQSPAETLLDAYHGRWNGSVDPLFLEEEYESFYATCR